MPSLRHEYNVEMETDFVCDLVGKAMESQDGAKAAPSGAPGLKVTSGKSRLGMEKDVSRSKLKSGLIIACWLEHGREKLADIHLEVGSLMMTIEKSGQSILTREAELRLSSEI